MIQKIIIKKGEYRDSVVLLDISRQLQETDGIQDALVVMATDSNKEILKNMGFLGDLAKSATPNDLLIALNAEDEGILADLLDNLDSFFLQKQSSATDERHYPTLQAALNDHAGANLALISIPGEWAGLETRRAMAHGLDVLLFSDNVPLEEEIELKQLAQERGVILMGPDCGVCNLNGTALALASQVNNGPVGLVGASGSGLQEISALLQHYGSGISHAIGTGGRDLHPQVGAISMLQGFHFLEQDASTRVLVLMVKSPAPAIRDQICQAIKATHKPVVVCSLGDDPHPWQQAGAYFAATMDSAAQLAFALAHDEPPETYIFEKPLGEILERVEMTRSARQVGQKYVRGIFGAGTFVSQAQWIFRDILPDLYSNSPFAGARRLADPTHSLAHSLVDLGDEQFTKGRAHPVIDMLPYRLRIQQEMEDPQTGVLLMDVILGPATHPDPAGFLVESIQRARQTTGRQVPVVVSVCGTDRDPQNRAIQEHKLSEAGIWVMPSSAQAAYLAGLLAAEAPPDETCERLRDSLRITSSPVKTSNDKLREDSPKERWGLLDVPLEVINVGVDLFAESLRQQGITAHKVSWSPPAGGNQEAAQLLGLLDQNTQLRSKIEQANQKAFSIFTEGQPVWKDVLPAGEIIPGYHPHLITHAGPPLPIDEMDPMFREGVLGAALIEGLADSREVALEMIRVGEIELAPAWWYDVPIAGMSAVSYSMPVMVAEDVTHQTLGFSPIMEGASYEALRSGIYNQVVHDRWRWFQTSLGPILSETLQRLKGIHLRNVISRSLLMGDENHSRETASTLIILAELAPQLLMLDHPQEELSRCLDFIRGAERFSQNILIAGAASVLAAARDIEYCSVVTGMGGNGLEMGLMISAFGKRMFTAPAPMIYGRYLNPSTTPEDTVPFAGDSCAVTVYGLGGCAAAASPAVTLLGGGTVADALNRTREMWEITVGKNNHYAIPNLNFEGTPTAFDILKILQTGILPVSHAGIVHKQGGLAGAGNARIPMALFVKAFLAFAEETGLK